MANVYSDISFELAYGDEFDRQVAGKSDPDPLIEISITAEDTESKKISQSRDWAGSILSELLASLDEIANNRKVVIRYHNGPSYLVFEPHDEDFVNITMCILLESVDDPENRLDVEETVTVAKDALVEEAICAAKEFRKKVISKNPNLSDSTEISRLADLIEEAEADFNVRSS